MPKLHRLLPILAFTAATLLTHAATSGTLLDINTATPLQLKALPGLGDAYIRRMIEGRPYTSKNQLVTRGVLPQAAYDKISASIVAKHPSR
jgi:competence protein ComEA